MRARCSSYPMIEDSCERSPTASSSSPRKGCVSTVAATANTSSRPARRRPACADATQNRWLVREAAVTSRWPVKCTVLPPMLGVAALRNTLDRFLFGLGLAVSVASSACGVASPNDPIATKVPAHEVAEPEVDAEEAEALPAGAPK